MRLSVSTKLIVLVTLPLFVQLGLLARLAILQSEAEADLKRSTYAGQISDGINKLSTDVYSILSTYTSEQSLEFTPLNDDVYRAYVKRLQDDYDALKQAIGNNPALLHEADVSEAAARESLAELFKLKQSFSRTGNSQKGRDERKPGWHKIRDLIRRIMESNLPAIGERQRLIADRGLEIQIEHRHEAQTMMLVGGALNLLLTAIAAFYLTRNIASRLRQMNDNTYRLASDLPLNPVIEGTDEIARLDQVFHQLQHALKEASRKEQDIFNNARDMIFTLDEHGRFTMCNPACESVLKLKKNELLGSYAVDKVAPEDKVKTLDYLEALKQRQGKESALEAQIKRGDETFMDSMWSAKWSPEGRTFFCIVHDVTERKQAERMKQEVLAMVSHDLRTPLTTTLNALDFLEMCNQQANSEKETRYIAMAKRNLSRMIALINDLLDIEKAKAGMMVLSTSPMFLYECFKLCEDTVIGFAEENKIHLDFEQTDLVIDADDQRIVRVFVNLVSNAVRFSNPDGTVKIYAVRKDSFAQVTVEDHGRGIPESQLHSIFERFQQVDGRTARERSGSGLGLAICKTLIELHGGQIWAESVEGKGSKFQMLIPLAREAVDAQKLVKQEQKS